MAKRSPIFIAAAGVLLVLNLGLAYAVITQRTDLATAETRALLERERDQLQARVTKAKEISAELQPIKSKNQSLHLRMSEIQPRLYDPEERAGVEMDLSQNVLKTAGRNQGLRLQQIKVSMTEDTGPFRRWTYTLLLQGKATLLPPLVQQIYKDNKLVMVGRVAASSPNFTFRNLDMAMDLHYFEAKHPSTTSSVRQSVVKAFDLKRSQYKPVEDEGIAAINSDITDLRQTLEGLEPDLIEAARLEADSLQMKETIAAYDTKLKEWRVNQQLLNENLPKLYLRVRGSTLGGAALVLEGDEVTFPEYSGED